MHLGAHAEVHSLRCGRDAAEVRPKCAEVRRGALGCAGVVRESPRVAEIASGRLLGEALSLWPADKQVVGEDVPLVRRLFADSRPSASG